MSARLIILGGGLVIGTLLVFGTWIASRWNTPQEYTNTNRNDTSQTFQYQPKRPRKRRIESPKTTDDCIICYEKLGNPEYWKTIKCDHTFHKKCLIDWVKQKNVCPICRTEPAII